MTKPAARLGDMHMCPMVTPGTPPVPHVGGPIMPPCYPPVLIGNMPAARVGDMCVCVGPPDSIVQGSTGVFIGNMPAARMGDMTAHGGRIVMGLPTVLIGETGSGGGVAPQIGINIAQPLASAEPSGQLAQGALPPTAPNSQSKPQLEAIAKDPTVTAAINDAWNRSNPNGPGTKKEKGFWVLKDTKTGQLSIQHFPDNGTNDSLTPGPVPNVPGKKTVAFFHTHPNTTNEGYASEPSPADRSFAKDTGVPGIIRSHDGMYYF